MNQQLHKRGLWSIDELSSDDVQTLLATARSLKQAQGRGVPLKGKHMAVLGDRSAGTGSDVFTMAALGLGAQVTHIPPRTLRLTASGDMGDAGRILGRLYDAIECDGMGEAFMLALKRAAAVPVSNVLTRDPHPTRMLADLMTMQEMSAGPIDGLTICVAGAEWGPWSVAWRQIAAVTGIDVFVGASPSDAGRRGNRPAFACDPTGERCSDGQPAFLMVEGRDSHSTSLAVAQVKNHRFVVQALLAQTVE